MKVYQGECECWTDNVSEQNIQTHLAAGDQFAGEAEMLRRWKESEEIPRGAKWLRFDDKTGADVYEWEA